jgi:hypothetical protein
MYGHLTHMISHKCDVQSPPNLEIQKHEVKDHPAFEAKMRGTKPHYTKIDSFILFLKNFTMKRLLAIFNALFIL